MPTPDIDDALLLPALRLVAVDKVDDRCGIGPHELRVGNAEFELVALPARQWIGEVVPGKVEVEARRGGIIAEELGRDPAHRRRDNAGPSVATILGLRLCLTLDLPSPRESL